MAKKRQFLFKNNFTAWVTFRKLPGFLIYFRSFKNFQRILSIFSSFFFLNRYGLTIGVTEISVYSLKFTVVQAEWFPENHWNFLFYFIHSKIVPNMVNLFIRALTDERLPIGDNEISLNSCEFTNFSTQMTFRKLHEYPIFSDLVKNSHKFSPIFSLAFWIFRKIDNFCREKVENDFLSLNKSNHFHILSKFFDIQRQIKRKLKNANRLYFQK